LARDGSAALAGKAVAGGAGGIVFALADIQRLVSGEDAVADAPINKAAARASAALRDGLVTFMVSPGSG